MAIKKGLPRGTFAATWEDAEQVSNPSHPAAWSRPLSAPPSKQNGSVP
jgi:hypothetical protein